MNAFSSNLRAAALASLTLTAATVQAQPNYDGFLCCNLRTDGSWISDSNYAESGKRVIPAGTPVKITGYGRQRVNIQVDGKSQSIGNDYSRDLNLEAFAKRYVVTEDPKPKIAAAPAKMREAIQSQRLMPGMTREQVLQSVGYPISSENPNLDARTWRMWLSSFAEFQVIFDERGRVKEVTTDPQTRNLVVMP